MAIDFEDEYPGQVAAASADYPRGAPRNISLPGDGSGTPWEAALIKDLVAVWDRLMVDGGVTPSGSPDTALVSDYYDALVANFATLARMPDDARAAAVSRVGIMGPHDAAPAYAEQWSRLGGGKWQVRTGGGGAAAESPLVFSRIVPKGLSLTACTIVLQGPSHTSYPPENAPAFYLRRINLNTAEATTIASETDAQISTQGTYESRHTHALTLSATAFAEDYNMVEVEVVPEYGTDAEEGTQVFGVILGGTVDRGRTL